MTIAAEEISFVTYCVENASCGSHCPLYDTCHEETSEPCKLILKKLDTNEELTDVEKKVIAYFKDDDQLWRRNKYCNLRGVDFQCPNFELCNDRETRGQKDICVDLLFHLGIYTPEEYQILEGEIEKIIINNLANIDWGFGEDLIFYDRQRRIAIGQPDILLFGKASNTLYVIELKPTTATREHVGQLQAYVAWYQENTPPEFKAVKGILLAKDFDDGAKYALKANPDLSPRSFELCIRIGQID